MIKSQKGFSLLEVIVSIAILSIILLSFFSFFIQAATFSSKTKDTFDAGQYSQELLHYAQTGNYNNDLTTQDLNDIYNTNQTSNKPYEIKINNQTYYPMVSIKPANSQTSLNSAKALLVTVTIETERDGVRKELFKTYGYK